MNLLFLVGLLSALFASPVALAQDENGITADAKKNLAEEDLRSPLKMSLGYRYGDFYYTEDKISDKSSLSGIAVRLNFSIKPTSFSIIGDLEYLGGLGTYTGQTWGGQPATAPTKNVLQNYRLLGEYRFDRNGWGIIEPFMGYGYRKLHNELRAGGGYARDIVYQYLPVGVKWVIAISNQWNIQPLAEYDVFIAGTATSHLSEVSDMLPDVTNTQSNGFGYRVALALTYEVSDIYLQIEPYYQYWHILDSNRVNVPIGGYVIEPENATNMSGLTVAVIF